MKAILIRAPFWIGLIIPALLIRFDIPALISLPLAYLIGFAACNVAWNIRAWIKREVERGKGAYKW
jgi:hypothetical protein